MAEQEITYIPYGQDEISQQDLMTSLANGIDSYLNSRNWGKKAKYRDAWLRAYQDIMTQGITGASNNTGIWRINHNGPNIDLSNKSNIEREMYGDAAYYIQQQMSQMIPRSKQEEKKEDEKLDKFDFQNTFKTQLLNNLYGGDQSLFANSETGWDSLDERDLKTGLRDTKYRKEAMAKQLGDYLKSLEGKNYDFEGTPFTDLNDARTKIQSAINVLSTDGESDDISAFNALGLNYRNFFSNGGNDVTTHLDSNGNPYTYNQWNEYQQQQADAKVKANTEAAKQKLAQQRANQYERVRYFGHNLAGKPLSPEHSNMDYLNSLVSKDNWTGDEQSELVGVFKLAAKNNQLQDLTKEELLRFGSGYSNRPGRLKKINGLNGLYWDTIGNRIVKPYAKGNVPQNNFQDVLDQNNPELIKQKQQATPISKEGWTSADTADVVSIIGDLVSLGGFWANIGGTATSLTSDLYADIARGKDLGSILKGVGVNLGWGLAGMLPGAKSTKLVARTARLIPKAIMAVQSARIILDPEVQKSAMKFTTVDGLKTVSSKDLENLKYLFHAVTGVTNITRSHVRAKNYREQLNKQKVQTKEGTKNLSNEDVKEINKAGRKGGQKAAEELFEKKTGQKAAEGQFKFTENGKSRFNPARYSSSLSKMFGNDQQLKGEQTTDLRAMSQILQKDKELPWYNWNKGYATFELTPFRSNPPIKQEQSKQRTNNQQKTQEQKTQNHDQKLLENKSNPREQQFDKATINRYKEHLKGNFSNKKIQEGTQKIGDKDMNITSTTNQKNGKVTYDIHFGNKHFYNLTQDKAKQRIFDLVKENRKQVDKTNGIISKKSTKEIGKILQNLKRKGWLKQGGIINNSLDTIIEDFIKNNNI